MNSRKRSGPSVWLTCLAAVPVTTPMRPLMPTTAPRSHIAGEGNGNDPTKPSPWFVHRGTPRRLQSLLEVTEGPATRSRYLKCNGLSIDDEHADDVDDVDNVDRVVGDFFC